MPSILATAAMAALSGGRKLSDVTACSHDICGRKLLQRHATSGPKFLKAGSNPVFNGNGDLLGREVYAGAFADEDFIDTDIDMDENGHNLKGNPSVTAKIVDDKVQFELALDNTYNHNVHACEFKIVPEIIGGETVGDATDGKLTSKTFNPYSGHAAVEPVDGVWAYDSGTFGSGKFTAVVADPDIQDHSLGYLGLEFDIEIDCALGDGVQNPEPTKIYHHTIVDAGGNQVLDGNGGKTYKKLRVRHKFVEDPSDKLDLTSDATTPITLADPAAQWGSTGVAHKKMPVNIQASTTVQTESGAVRFPAGEWALGGAFGAQAKTAGAKLSCQINQGTLVGDLDAVEGDWFDANAGGVAVEAAYGPLDDVQCTGDTAGVSCGISYTAAIGATTDRALGFQVPLSKYYSAVPTVSCTEDQNSQSASKEVDINGRGSHALGVIKKSLAFTGLTPSVTDFGEGFFTLDAGANEKVFGKLFTVAQAGEAAWYDLLAGDGTYDYQWQLKYNIVGGGSAIDESGAGSTDTGLIASLGSSLSAVQGALEDKVIDASSGIIATTKFARPTQYGEERHEYSIGAEEATAAFRRRKAEIQLTITGQTDGTLDYDGADSAPGIGFPGYEETFTVTDATITACDYCKEGTTGGKNNDVKLSDPALTGTEQAAEWQLFQDDDTADKTDATLFDQSAAICDGSETKAWCVSKATADDTVGRGTKVQCKDQSVTFQVTATMDADDNRQLRDSVTVTRTYPSAAAGEPDKPTTAARAGIQYQLAGAQLTQEFTNVALATDPQGLGALTFTRPHNNPQGYSCSAAEGTVFTYTSPYYTFCDAQESPITYDVATNVVYSPAQVKVSAALKANSAGTSAATIREYDLQGRQDGTGVDIEFTVTAATLQFDNSLEVKVKHAALDGGETTLSVADGTCVLKAGGASADCTLAGFTDGGFDPLDTLDIDDHCGQSGEVACPSFALEVSQVFNVPETDGTVGAFQPTSVTSGDDCATSRRHIISLQGSTSTAEDIDITIDVDGSDVIHNELVELIAHPGGYSGSHQRFAHALAESGSESTGKDGEYQTTLTLGDETTLLPANMKLLNLEIKIHGEDVSQDIVTYTVKNEGAASDYKMYLCANGNNYGSCGTNEIPSGGNQKFLFGSGTAAGVDQLYVRIDDASGSGADPCLDKIKGTQAFGTEGIKFSIARNGEQAHTYTVPITCHTSGTPTISYVAGPTNNGINWNQELLTVAVSGRSIDATKKVQILEISNNGQPVADGQFRTLEVDAEASLVTDPSADDYLQAVLTLQFEKIKEKCEGVTTDVTFDGESYEQALVCPESTLGVVGIQADSLVAPTATFGDVLALDMLITGRDELRYGQAVQLRASTGSDNSETGETVVFLNANNEEVSEIALPDSGAGSSAETAYIKVKPGTSGRIECNFMEIELSAFTVANDDSAESRKSLTFRMKCPRQQSASAAADTLDLDYDVTTFTYARGAMVIAVPEDPETIAGLSSVIGLGKCDGTTLISLDPTCRLVAGTVGNTLAGGEGGLDLFDTCAKHSYDGTTWGASTITSSATVARQYTKSDAVFGPSTFCGETPLSISVTTTKTTSISIAVADNNDMRFDVHMSELAWIEDTDACAEGEYRLKAVVDMKRQLGVNTNGAFVPLTGADGSDLPYVTTGIQSFYRSGLTDVTYYKDAIAGYGFTPADRTEDTGFKMIILGDCATADSNDRTLTFVMKVEQEGVDYFSHATITFEVDAPMSDDEDLDFDEADVTSLTECGLVGADFTGQACGAGDIPSNFQVKLSVGVSDDTGEASAFRHTYSAPRIKQSAVDASCDLFATAEDASTHCPLVTSLTPVSSYEAVLTVDGVTGGQPLVQGVGDDTNSIVMLKTVPFAGDTAVEIGWTISRVENQNGAGRRLRSVQHVTYKLGADGSVSKSSSFAVLPAVRDSEDASAVTTQEQITEQELDANGDAVGTATVVNRTTVQHDKSGEDHTLAVLGIVFGGLGSVAAIAVALFVGCASRRDASGAGSSFSTVAGGFSDRQPLFNRNRFAPSDF